jgi:hypothetical protein
LPLGEVPKCVIRHCNDDEQKNEQALGFHVPPILVHRFHGCH